MDIVEHLGRLDLGKVTGWELDAGMALAMGLPMRLLHDDNGQGLVVEVSRNNAWQAFSPTTSWEDFGLALQGLNLVVGSHGGQDGEPRWYSAHAFNGGTSYETYGDIRVVAARAATSRARGIGWEGADLDSLAQMLPSTPGGHRL